MSASIYQLGIGDLFVYGFTILVIYSLFNVASSRLHGTQTTSLRGPPSKSILFGLYRYINQSEDPEDLLEEWATEYGPAYRLPGGFGSYKIIITDPKAVAHFYARETFVYVQTPLARIYIENLFGRGLLWSEGESHKRQRKTLSPAFNNTAIRKLTSVFYDSSYKMKTKWESILDSSAEDSAVIDVQKWMNHVALDSIGIAGFGHDFGSLDGNYPVVVEVLEIIGASNADIISHLVFLMGPVLPLLLKLPTGENRLIAKLRLSIGQIADELLDRTRKEREGKLAEEEKSVIGLLVKAESGSSQIQMSQEEVMAQSILLLAGYETTSITLTWALIELSRHPEKQRRLREELSQFPGAVDPTWEQLSSNLPYLDSVVHEVLRLHPPITESSRIAAEDDVIPLSTPVVTSTGETVSSITIKKGTTVVVPMHTINKSEAFWPNAKEFKPERWLEDPDIPAKQFQGHRHILSFSDGARFCIGRGFALAEFKAVLSVLIRNYKFELLDGPDTKIQKHRSILPRPKVAGQENAKVPLRVRRVE